MKTINTITLLGNIGKVEIVEFKDESIITKISLATNNLVGGAEQTQWHTLVFKGRCAHVVSLLQKGDQLMVNGMMTYRSWKDNHGQSRIAPEVIITDSVGEFSIITGQIGQIPDHLKTNFQRQAPQQRTQAQPRQAPQQRTQPRQQAPQQRPQAQPRYQDQYQDQSQDLYQDQYDPQFNDGPFDNAPFFDEEQYAPQPQAQTRQAVSAPRQAPQQQQQQPTYITNSQPQAQTSVKVNQVSYGKPTNISYNYNSN